MPLTYGFKIILAYGIVNNILLQIYYHLVSAHDRYHIKGLTIIIQSQLCIYISHIAAVVTMISHIFPF